MPEYDSSHIHVVLADDHDLVRQGMKRLLSLQPEIHIVGEARTGKEAIEQTQKYRPQVVVMDISMPDMDGLEACKHIRERQPTTNILMLSIHESEGYFFQALRAGAAGYLIKKAAPTELYQAILSVAQGGAFLYPSLAAALIRAYTTLPHIQEPDTGAGVSVAEALRVLSPREREVLKLVAEGNTNQEIADRLVISIKTVQAHRAHVMEKLGLEHITQLVRFAIRHGLIPPGL
ncbi:DNA-binding response regulator [Ktedonobacter sp. SOSP1-52]|uniref:response regulator n=1 Tax=Ktedonobacter sp. SOSP1-52 TaxID=2778366 RepID=UPI001915B70F|nr:response regulator transcription factor [Ktedonobacter sp. SOSP1-52]GHO63652.1 DNA-binding response regulator [Ktedonobacter sp. SOSP1-52]